MTSPLPRTTTSGTRSGRPTSASAPAWPGGGNELDGVRRGRRAPPATARSRGSTSAVGAARARPTPVRSTAALRALSTWEATSTVTLGRASNTAPITPTGTRRSNTRSPVGSVRTKRCSGGSGVSASTSSWTAMSASRSGVSRSRSSRPPVMPPRSRGVDVGGVRGEQRRRRGRAARPAAVRRAASTAAPPAARTPGAAAAAACAAARTAACSGASVLLGTVPVLTRLGSHAGPPARVRASSSESGVGKGTPCERRLRSRRSVPDQVGGGEMCTTFVVVISSSSSGP